LSIKKLSGGSLEKGIITQEEFLEMGKRVKHKMKKTEKEDTVIKEDCKKEMRKDGKEKDHLPISFCCS
jgi:hypothetical protein